MLQRKLALIVLLGLASSQTRAEIAPWDDGFTLPPGDYSWIQLTSDEWLKGEFISLYYELFINMTFLNEASGQYQHHIVTTLSTDLIKDVDLDVSLIWDHTQKPQERIDTSVPEKDDFHLLFSINYDF